MKILITGGEGYIGGWLYEYLHKKHKVYKERIELLELATVKEKVQEIRPDVIIHCAGASSVAQSFQSPHIDFEKNVITTQNLLEAIRSCSDETHFIYLSSAAVYGNPVSSPITETTLTNPISPYGYNKYISELIIKQYTDLFKISATVLRIFSVYGQGMCKQVVFDIFEKFNDPNTETILLSGTGNETRDFIHIIDLCRVIEVVIKNKIYETINVASGESVSIKKLANAIKTEMNSQKSITFLGDQRIGDPISWIVSVDTLKSKGFNRVITLQEGLKQYNEWYTGYKKNQ